MDVRCDRCETEYELDDAIVADGGASVQCTTCGHTFMVNRRRSSPHNQVASQSPPAPGTPASDSSGPNVPEWTLSTNDGKIHRFRDLNVLQKWIVERKVARTERISRAGGPWLALDDVLELAPFFDVVDEADRARASTGMPGGIPTPPSFPASAAWSGPAPSRPVSGPARTVTPPPVPADARRPLSDDGPTVPNRSLREDGPTVPNRRLPGAVAASGASHQVALPGVRDSQGGTRGGSPFSASAPSFGASAPSEAREPLVSTIPISSASPSLTGASAAREGIRPVSTAGLSPLGRGPAAGPFITAETNSLELELRPSHAGRNAALIVTAIAVLGGAGGYWWWTEQKRPPANAPARGIAVQTAPSPPSSAVPAASGQIVALSGARAAVGGAPPAGDTSIEKSPGVPAGPGRAARGPIPPANVRTGSQSASQSGSYERLVADADRLLEQGKAAKADKLYAQALVGRPAGVAALTGSGFVLLDRQRHDKAVETFRRALAVQPTFGPALFGLAEAYRAQGDTAQALGTYRKYLAIAPSGADASAARHQIKELESAGNAPTTSDRSPSVEQPPPPPPSVDQEPR